MTTTAKIAVDGTAKSAPFAVAIETGAEPSHLTSKEWLAKTPFAAYTTARTHQGKLFEWSTHVDRTAATILAMDPTPPARSLAEHGGPFFRARLDGAAAAAISTYRALQGDAGEVKVTILVSWDEEKCSVAAHAGPLPPLPARPVRVEVRGEGRANAAAKDSGWVAERAPLEKLMAAAEVGPVNELLLKDYQGRILEGSQTNFYAVVAGKLVTAGDDILKGTVRRLAIEVCEREGIPVVLEPPDLDNVADWDGCLISSTSRLMLPIDELYKPAEGAPATAGDLLRTFDNGPDSLAARLQALVASEVEAHSEAVAF